MGQGSSTGAANVILLGLDGSGKTSILARLLGDDPRTVLPTLGFTVRAFSFSDESLPPLKVWDQGGVAAMRRYWPAYYSKAHAIAFVIDSSDRRRLAETSAVLQEVLDDDALLGVPLLVLANKQDAPDAISASEIEGLMHLGSIRDRTWRCLACSALRGRGLVDGLRWLAETHVGGGASGDRRSGAFRSTGRLGRWRKRAHAHSGNADGAVRNAGRLGRWRNNARNNNAARPEPAPSAALREPSRPSRRTRPPARKGGSSDDDDDDDDVAESTTAPAPAARAPGRRTRPPVRKGGSSDDDDDVAESTTAPAPAARAPAPSAGEDEDSGAGVVPRTRSQRARRQQPPPKPAADAVSDDE